MLRNWILLVCVLVVAMALSSPAYSMTNCTGSKTDLATGVGPPASLSLNGNFIGVEPNFALGSSIAQVEKANDEALNSQSIMCQDGTRANQLMVENLIAVAKSENSSDLMTSMTTALQRAPSRIAVVSNSLSEIST